MTRAARKCHFVAALSARRVTDGVVDRQLIALDPYLSRLVDRSAIYHVLSVRLALWPVGVCARKEKKGNDERNSSHKSNLMIKI